MNGCGSWPGINDRPWRRDGGVRVGFLILITLSARGICCRVTHHSTHCFAVYLLCQLLIHERRDPQQAQTQGNALFCKPSIVLTLLSFLDKRRPVLVVVQNDVTERAQMEALMADFMQAQLAMLAQIFPRWGMYPSEREGQVSCHSTLTAL